MLFIVSYLIRSYFLFALDVYAETVDRLAPFYSYKICLLHSTAIQSKVNKVD